MPSDVPLPSQDPGLLRRLLRAKDRMDAASHEAWPVSRLANVSGVSEAHFARSFRHAFGVPPLLPGPLAGHVAGRAGGGDRVDRWCRRFQHRAGAQLSKRKATGRHKTLTDQDFLGAHSALAAREV